MGAVIQAAQVTTPLVETNVQSQTKTDVEGRLRFANLRLQKYEITISQTGIADPKTALMLAVCG